MFGYREGYSSTDGALTIDDESLNGRMVPSYAGITTTLAANVDNATTANVSLTDLSTLDVNIGDYLMVDDELVRVKTTNAGTNPLSVFRGVLGTKAAAHDINSIVMLDSVLVTTPPLCHRSRIVRSLVKKRFYHNPPSKMVV
jgi:hypothetical protein